ncbi:DNA polymerase Y family protein [Tateyamaria sp. ANG-S1]|uniref:Y-family DNA polymerase n=1 Tax=Tateyamaria sp. ANG-S1 TaxID=1577905 RepID=UPI00057D21A2|nr:DNA polymerase Y family protein [Tateyamaria sp. ANG-S1]KIC49887.1 DNA methylase [Tateyamaria sp. ANG-S1]
MPNRRILSIWFPRLGAERLIRRQPVLADQPVAVVEEQQNMQVITALNGVAQADGLQVGQPVRDAHAMCLRLLTFPRSMQEEKRFLEALQRWAGKFSPWVAPEDGDALVIDLTGCAHLFGGERELMQVVQDDCTDLGLSVLLGLADTRGAAWALARYAGKAAGSDRSGDSIDQEARATRSRAGKRRHWTKGGAAPAVTMQATDIKRIAPPGQTYGALSPLPIAALRLDAEMTAQLGRLGLRRVGDLLGQPRAGLARRFGRGLVMRLDQAMGSAPEPVSPAKPPDHFAVRMTLPDPIGLAEDVMAAIDRTLPRLCKILEDKGKGARRVMLQAYRSDHAVEVVEIGLARPTHDPHRIRPLLEMKIEEIDAGFGIDMIRVLATLVEPVHDVMTVGHREAGAAVQARLNNANAMDDLIGRLGARVGLDSIRRFEPADSHIPEKSHKIMSAAWSKPHEGPWPMPTNPRPLLLWHPEPVQAPNTPKLPENFRWRGMNLTRHRAIGPERIAPEWWLDDPNWRSGTRDYWVTDTTDGQRLWLFYAHGGAMSAGWFCHGSFA